MDERDWKQIKKNAGHEQTTYTYGSKEICNTQEMEQAGLGVKWIWGKSRIRTTRWFEQQDI